MLLCASQTNTSPTAWASDFHLVLHINKPSFSGQEFGDLSCTDFCHQQMFIRDHLNSTTADAHTVGYQLHVDSTILQYDIFNSTTVFVTENFARMSRLGLILKASSASTKLSTPTCHHGIRGHIFTVYNSHSFVYLLRLNVLQCQKFYHRTIAYFIKIRRTVQLAIFNTSYLIK